MKIHRKQGANVAHSVTVAPSQAKSELRLATVAIGGQKADEFGHENEGTWRRFGEAEPVKHLACAQPTIGLHRLLRHVGEHRIGAAEGHHGKLGEEQRGIRRDMGAAE